MVGKQVEQASCLMSLRTAAITGEDADAVVEIGTQARAEEARVPLSQSQFAGCQQPPSAPATFAMPSQ